MGYRIIEDDLWEDGRNLRIVGGGEGRVIIAVMDASGCEGGVDGLATAGGRWSVEEVLNAIYEAAPSHAPDGWKPTPEWAAARVVEGTDSDGDRRIVVRAYDSVDGDRWVTDTAIHWSQASVERGLTDIRILVGADDD